MNRSVLVLLFALSLFSSPAPAAEKVARPNVVVIITDDQGHGDLGCHGNPKIRTPYLDRLAGQGVHLVNFYACPVCSPTRASLLTGRYNYRTGVVDTYIGRSMMHSDEATLAEMLRDAGYRTGIFGKWHLGDCYPMRPQDQGFDECLVGTGGGLTQPSDPPGNTYFDPILRHNGKPVQTKGYCTDVFTDAAIRFIEQKSDKPFFTYLAYNCPHDPLQVAEEYVAPYRKLDLATGWPRIGQSLPAKLDVEAMAKTYAMVTNIDDNVGRLLKRLDEGKLSDNTLVVFMTDNGPQRPRYNSGLRDVKGSVYEGGIRVPGYVRWPARLKPGHKVTTPTAHIDLAPTILEACGVAWPAKVKADGWSVLPLLEGKKIDWPERTLYTQWHRGDVPEKFRAFAARGPRYKLVQPHGVAPGSKIDNAKLQLYDLNADPYEEKDLASDKPEIVEQMKKGYEEWFADVSRTRGYAPPRIHLGAAAENPTLLTRQDWRGPKAGWTPNSLGFWEVYVTRPGTYRLTLRFATVRENARANFTLLGVNRGRALEKGQTECVFEKVVLPKGDDRLQAEIVSGQERVGVHYVEVERTGE